MGYVEIDCTKEEIIYEVNPEMKKEHRNMKELVPSRPESRN
jgi:hypothetical protein